MTGSEQVRLNLAQWAEGRHIRRYANRVLAPVEALLLVRYREALSGRVLDAGCGAGRVLGYLLALGGEVHGIDIAPRMVEYCQTAFPDADVRLGDVGALDECVDGRFDVILATSNLIDVFDDAERHRVLAGLRDVLAPGGMLIFSSHNLGYLLAERNRRALPARVWALVRRVSRMTVAELVRATVCLPRRARNRRRLRPLESWHADYAIVNDFSHDYSLLHYYIRRDDQARQLADAGFELLECLDVDGDAVGAGEVGAHDFLYYVARAS